MRLFPRRRGLEYFKGRGYNMSEKEWREGDIPVWIYNSQNAVNQKSLKKGGISREGHGGGRI